VNGKEKGGDAPLVWQVVSKLKNLLIFKVTIKCKLRAYSLILKRETRVGALR
jgi:hypothetical protein